MQVSLEMTYNVVRIFLAFSSFAEMHPLLSQYKAGALTMKVGPTRWRTYA